MSHESNLTTVATRPEPNHRFTTTHWSLILLARDQPGPVADNALQKLCETYWFPVYSFIRSQYSLPDDAQDLTQEFFARLLARDFLKNVDPSLGRFRSFLLASAKHFLADQRDRAKALKRGGGHAPLSFDAVEAEERHGWEPADTSDPEKLFDRRWALTLLNRVLEQLEAELASQGKTAAFVALKGFLVGDKTGGSYSDAGRRLGVSEGAVKNMVWRWRQRSRELFLTEIAHTVTNPQAAEAELRHLFEALAS
jgi:RNA polymerase sigma factor (sigma-70 family)